MGTRINTNQGEIDLNLYVSNQWNELFSYGTEYIINVKHPPDGMTPVYGDGSHDDTDTSAIQSILDLGGNIYFPKGTYMIDTFSYALSEYVTAGLIVKSNTRLFLHPEAILKSIPNNQEWFNVLLLKDVSNILIEGGIIQGERTDHIGTTGEWGHGINIIGDCSNIVIKDLTCKDHWGDGIYIGSGNYVGTPATTYSPSHLRIYNIISTNNRRQGISIVSCNDLIIKDSVFSYINGTAPQSGIAIEPNTYESTNLNYPKNITIENCTMNNCTGDGFYCAFDSYNISLIGCKSFSNGRYGYGLLNLTTRNGHEKTLFQNCEATSNVNIGFFVSKSSDTKLQNCKSTLNYSGIDISTTCSEVLIEKCHIASNQYNAMNIRYGITELTISKCTIKDNCTQGTKDHQIAIGDTDDATGVVGAMITGNKIIGSILIGITIKNDTCQYITIKDNEWKDHTGGVRVQTIGNGTGCHISLGYLSGNPISGFYTVGTYYELITPVAGAYRYMVCTVAGNVGTWKGTSPIQA